MEDVFLHYKSGPDQDLPSLIGTTERLLAPFPCRPPQVFSPWFPSIVDRHLPLRPARHPPKILSAPAPSTEEVREETGLTQDLNQTASIQDQNQTGPNENLNQTTQETREKTGPNQDPNHIESTQDQNQTSPNENLNSCQTGPTQRHDNFMNGETSPRVDEHEVIRSECPFVPETPPGPGLQVQTGSGSKPDSPSKRCWTVFRHRVQTKDRTKDQTKVKCRVQTSSRRFLQTVSKLRLHPRQRVKWVIDKNNCRDIEQVWRCLSRPSLSALPSSCNAHIVRDQAQIWLYCDLVQSEEVGLRLKEELSLRGRISLWERSHGNIYCL
ncbi:shieldin complex subunit 3 isoform X2 [Periophthalmus magnuspinnatus]|uniref:shieldin complex subunit 3 isoform X2 n=1 Tax=Periophthalmus magnuspinnatus TaxID=409849 RepID=UPI0024366E14|nr:shieldin complex subunit 3 isoform X2 [Periophthalmus magnuspinnatus]